MDDRTAPSNKDAMSRALGAAFLSHQVEQLEKTVSNTPSTFGHLAYDHRNRRSSSFGETARGRGSPRRGGAVNAGRPHGGTVGNVPGRPEGEAYRSQRFESRGRDTEQSDFDDKDGEKNAKDADVIVADASVLVHAIGELKKWCRFNREEIVIVPLEALNTLDMLKKGSSPLAQRARAASRILEQQVGTNPRIIVQRDDAFVLWDEIPLSQTTASAEPGSDTNKNLEVEAKMTPEWLRRTICCARWEVEHVQDTVASAGQKVDSNDDGRQELSVKLAVCVPPSVDEANTSTSTLMDTPTMSKQEQRAAGVLVSLWASRTGVSVFKVEYTPLPGHNGGSHPPVNGNSGNLSGGGGRPRSRHNRASSDEDRRGPPAINGGGSRGRGGSSVGRKSGPKPHYPITAGGGEKLVERPATTVAMNANAILQPTRVVRVLARGEKLEP